ncbi:tetratricopeptide repeat protein [Algibacillus agarilyticus]|uniref:tetratricopeptide repeat protein n=1 Tax=Algibacillus agarilyticus TaxID=2234133 RepID=UPI000DD064A0|nr:hypothetical protein [Algibacillus agarilyticus]
MLSKFILRTLVLGSLSKNLDLRGVFCILLLCLPIHSWANTDTVAVNENFKSNRTTGIELADLLENKQEKIKTDLQDKAYRQALFYYFQGENSQALSFLNQTKQRLGFLDEKASLFEAGLQVSLGLQYEAQRALIRFVMQQELDDKYDYRKTAKIQSQQTVNAAQKELLLIALLQLAEQKVSQADYKQAQQALAKIRHVPAIYYDQYHVLNQLAYWPNTPTLLPVSEIEAGEYKPSLFIIINQAIKALEDKHYSKALSLLATLDSATWHKTEPNFWQRLFTSGSGENKISASSVVNYQVNSDEQLQALKDYAQLLKANVYFKQERFDLAFAELKAFPQETPFSESAMFLFANSALEVKNTQQAHLVWQIFVEKYPYSTLAWQSALMHAEVLLTENHVDEAYTYYDFAEKHFLTRLKELTVFANEFTDTTDLLNFKVPDLANKNNQSVAQVSKHKFELTSDKVYQTDSVWLNQALRDPELASWYQNLIQLDLLTEQLLALQAKLNWINEILVLNVKRIEAIKKAEATQNTESRIKQLIKQRDQLASLLISANKHNSLSVFANADEKALLTRLAKSEGIITNLNQHNKNTDDYTERLARVKGVLTWDVLQNKPERYWQYNKAIKQIDQALSLAQQQVQTFRKVSKQNTRLERLTSRFNQANETVRNLLITLGKVRVINTTNIRQTVINKTLDDKAMLSDFILKARRELARIIEAQNQASTTVLNEIEAL